LAKGSRRWKACWCWPPSRNTGTCGYTQRHHCSRIHGWGHGRVILCVCDSSAASRAAWAPREHAAQVTVTWPCQPTALCVREVFGRGQERRTIAVYQPSQHGVSRQTGCWRSPFVDSRVTYARHSWKVGSMDQRGVSHAPIGGGLRGTAVGTPSASRGVPGPSCTSRQRTASRASPRRSPCPVPVTPSLARVRPPDHATVRRGRSAVCATTVCGEARCGPCTRGRPRGLGGRGGGGAVKAASPSTLLPHVR
jgi:hypothetical protein